MSNSRKKPSNSNHGDDEVEQMLRAAQDELILKLKVIGPPHAARVSEGIDPELDRRFQALKNPLKPNNLPCDPPTKTDLGVEKSGGPTVSPDDLYARFAALKSPETNTSQSPTIKEEEEDIEEDEVQKVIRWAIDAARLDPSPLDDDEEEDDDDDDDYALETGTNEGETSSTANLDPCPV